jgi:hypothetical protein
MRRLVKLDRELCERRALVGVSGEPFYGSDSSFGISEPQRARSSNVNAKTCVCCSRGAQYSVACVVSTLGVSPRHQKCSPVILFCESCLQELCEGAVPASWELRQALKHAYTALNRLPEIDDAFLSTKF